MSPTLIKERPSQRVCYNPRAWAFTLIELLVSVTLLAFLAAMLFSILNATSDLWRVNESRVDSYREARAALNLMARELGAFFSDPSGTTDPAEKLSLLVINPKSGTVTQPGEIVQDSDRTNARLFFLATLSGATQDPKANRSDLCALGYYIAFTFDRTAFSADQPESVGSYKLYRHFRSSDATFAAVQSCWDVDKKRLFLDPATIFMPTPSGGDEILARNITRFEIRAFERVVDAVTQEFLGVKEFDLGTNTWPRDKKPAFLEISLTAVNQDTAARLTDRNAWRQLSSAGDTGVTQRFSTRVTFPD